MCGRVRHQDLERPVRTHQEGLYGIWGSSDSNVFAAGRSGTILHYDGVSWTPMTTGMTADLYGAWGSSATEVFAAGARGTILRYDGATSAALFTAGGMFLQVSMSLVARVAP